MNPDRPVVFLTAGAAGMYCGSCMHDNALAKALIDSGEDCMLQPVYTPIRTDEPDVAVDGVFFGGVHVYLLNEFPLVRRIPRRLRRWLDWPPLIRLATRRAQATDPGKLGRLAVSMLRGEHGNQAEEVRRLVDWLAGEVRPKAIVLSNLLIGGAIPAIRRALPETRIIVLLQGDDIFLDHLPVQHQEIATALCHELAAEVDHFVVNSCFYRDKMAARMGIALAKFQVAPLTIDTSAYSAVEPSRRPPSAGEPVRLGYLARIAPEKGLHRLVDAFVDLAKRPQCAQLQLHVAGWLGEANRAYLDEQIAKIDRAGLSDRFVHHGSPDMAGKVAFLRSVDLLSVPTVYEDPKGLFVLEANAMGVPVIQPDHGAFAELVAATGGGITVAPGDHDALADAIADLTSRADLRLHLGQAGRLAVLARYTAGSAARRLQELWA